MLLYLLLFFFLGLIFGSFLNSLIYRLYYNLSVWDRSFCPKCQQKIKLIDLVPLVSFIFLGGKCRYCQKRIAWHYFVVELVTGILFALVFLKNSNSIMTLFRDLFFVLVLILIFTIDLKYYLILDKIIWPSIAVALIFNIILNLGIWQLILGIIIGAGFFGWQYLLSAGKWVGEGDIKLGALIGVMFGWQLTLLTIVTAYLIGGLIAAILLISKKKKIGDVLPLGTFLSAAAIIVLLWGEKILNFYF